MTREPSSAPSPTVALIRHQMWLLRAEPSYLIAMIVMPLVLMAFLEGALATSAPGGDGATQAVPGMVVMFSLFLTSMVPFNIFQEHGWGTWERLRAAPARRSQLMIGMVVGPLLCLAAQQAVLFGLGSVVVGFTVRGPLWSLLLVATANALCLVALGLAMLAVCKSTVELNTLSNLLALALAGLGGAITPLSTLPAWAQRVSPLTPSYWAMRGFTAAIVGTVGTGEVMRSVAALGVFTLLFLVVAVRRFRLSDEKLRNT